MPNKKTEAVEVFRQFAWNLAGSLAVPKPRRRPRRHGKSPATQTGARR